MVRIKARRNNRCKGGFIILKDYEFFRFLRSRPGDMCVIVDEDNNVIKTFVLKNVYTSNNNYRLTRCDKCALGRTMAKKDYCRYISCWTGKILGDMDDILEDL